MEINYDKIPKALIEKIQKILKLQESEKAIGNVEAAATYAQKISEILMKYNLDLNAVASVDTSAKPAIQEVIFDTNELEKSHEGGWVLQLIRVVARANMCRVLAMKGSPKAWVIGTETNAYTVWFITEQLVNRLRPIKAEKWAEYTGYEKRNTWTRGFFAGAVTGIGAQFMEKERKDKERARDTQMNVSPTMRTEDQQTGLMIVKMQQDEEVRVNAFVNKNYRLGGASSKRGTSSVGGKETGYNTGKSMNVHSGLASGSKRIG